MAGGRIEANRSMLLAFKVLFQFFNFTTEVEKLVKYYLILRVTKARQHTWQEEAEWRHAGPYIDFQLHKQPTVLFFVLFLKKKSFLVNVIPIA